MKSLNRKTTRKTYLISNDDVNKAKSRLDQWLNNNEDVEIISIVSLGKVLFDCNILIVFEKEIK